MPVIRSFERRDLEEVVELCRVEGWQSLSSDPPRALRVLTASGVTTVVAVADDQVVGFAQLLSDGEIQAFLANIVVEQSHRRSGIARALVIEGLRRAGGSRIDLLSEDGAGEFYAAFPSKRKMGFRLYPFQQTES